MFNQFLESFNLSKYFSAKYLNWQFIIEEIFVLIRVKNFLNARIKDFLLLGCV